MGVDDLWPVVLAVACVLGAAIAIVWVIYSAPVLLAEVAVDAATIIFAALAGYALQKIAPEARSIGGVIRTVAE